MIELLNAIGDNGDLIQDWEITRQPGGVLLRLRSRQAYATTEAATAAGLALVERFTGSSYELVSEPVVRARADEATRSEGWQGWAEVVLRRVRLGAAHEAVGRPGSPEPRNGRRPVPEA
jgi:hypothetical protein